ncbi:unnamed protein product [Effrenium voratum]|nr:unnamed protein product [Effrenium voratum]
MDVMWRGCCSAAPSSKEEVVAIHSAGRPKVLVCNPAGDLLDEVTLNFPNANVLGMLEWLTMALEIPPDVLVELALGGVNLDPEKPCSEQGLVDGARLVVHQRPARPKEGSYSMLQGIICVRWCNGCAETFELAKHGWKP